MQVLSLFKKVEIRLISDKQLVAAITHIDGCGVNLVAIAKMDTVEVTTEQHRH